MKNIIMQHYAAINDIVAIISLFFLIVFIFAAHICLEGEQK